MTNTAARQATPAVTIAGPRTCDPCGESIGPHAETCTPDWCDCDGPAVCGNCQYVNPIVEAEL